MFSNIVVYLDGIVRHAKIWIDPIESVLHLRMTIVQILTCSGWAVSGSNRLLDLLQFDAHVVDVRVKSDKVHVTVLLWPRLT